MRLRIIYICLLLITSQLLLAQPSPCGANPAMTPTCVEACTICDIDGFTGINNSNIKGQAPPGFCTSQVHHMQWIAFIAGTTNLTIELEVYNCRGNDGLEVGIYEAIECKNYRKVSDCDTDIPPNTKRVFKNTVPLTIGQYYYWVMDGSANDVCNYTIRVLEGSTKVAPLTVAAEIEVPSVICQGKQFNATTKGVVGATIYEWWVDGIFAGSGTVLPIEFNSSGTHQLCLDAMNVCDRAPQKCIEVQVLPAKESTLKHEVCFGECFNYGGQDFCTQGIHDVIFAAANGCDSIVHLDLKIKDQVEVFQQARICEGDSLVLGEDAFFTEGPHIGFVADQEGCKVKVNLDLEVIKCNIRANAQIIPVSCTGKKDGRLKFAITHGTPPFTYQWKRLENESEVGKGTVSDENVYVEIPDLDEGTYLIEIFDNFGNVSVVQSYVTQPSRLLVSIKDTLVNGYHLLCHGDTSATLTAQGHGGTGQYSWLWSTGENTTKISNQAAGIKEVSITDENGCISRSTIEVTEPEALQLSTTVSMPDCSAYDSGSIDLTDSLGGVGHYQLLFNNVVASFPISQLGTGIYTTKMIDANGCTTSVSDTLKSLEIPEIWGDSLYSILLGDSIEMELFSSVNPDNVTWKPELDLFDPQRLQTKARPVKTRTYLVTVTSVDGCSRTYEVVVNVQKRRSFIIANGLTKNQGANHQLRYFAGHDVASVIKYTIYDRWGSKVYEATDLPIGVIELPWDLTINGKPVMGGVYTWTAEVAYIDGEVVSYTGGLTIVD